MNKYARKTVRRQRNDELIVATLESNIRIEWRAMQRYRRMARENANDSWLQRNASNVARKHRDTLLTLTDIHKNGYR